MQHKKVSQPLMSKMLKKVDESNEGTNQMSVSEKIREGSKEIQRCERETNNESHENIRSINAHALTQKINFFHTLEHIMSVVARTSVIDTFYIGFR